MSSEHSGHDFLPRRQFLKLAVGATLVVGAPLLAACGSSQPTSAG